MLSVIVAGWTRTLRCALVGCKRQDWASAQLAGRIKLPATATTAGLIVLGQVPTICDLTGIALVIVGVAVHRAGPRAIRQNRACWGGLRARRRTRAPWLRP